ncbi:hypothetical protein G6F27_006564 [Rhizopus arrhizus]|nr:hypothetical protein G6F27_006564 [Rhizopus arrhizus]
MSKVERKSILAEAQTLNSNVRIGNDEIEVNIDGDINLSITKLPVTSTIESYQDNKICMTNLAFRLLLLQRYDFNMWKNKARILSTNHIIQNPLAKKSDTGTSSTNTSTNNHHSAVISRARNQVELPKTVAILSPVLSISKFWAQFDRIRQVVYSILYPFRRLGFSVHYKVLTDNNSNNLHPSCGKMSLYFNIGLNKGSHLQFALNQQSGTISVILPQATVVLQHVSELRAFLSREINIMCLGFICDVANDIIRVHPHSAQKMLLWKLNRIDEVIHSSLCTKEDQWKHINVQLFHDTTSFHVQFIVTNETKEEKVYIKDTQEYSAMTFKEKVSRIIQEMMGDD